MKRSLTELSLVPAGQSHNIGELEHERASLSREKDRLGGGGGDDHWFDERPAPQPERLAEINVRLAEIDGVLGPHYERTRRAEWAGVALKAGFPRRAVTDGMAGDLDTSGPYFKALEGLDPELIVLSGGVGTGKTTATSWWGCRRHVAFRRTTFITAAELARSSRYGEEREKLLSADALVIDDLGAEYLDAKGNFLTDFDELIDRFYSDRRPLVLTTNIAFPSPEARGKAKGTEQTFADRYGNRAVDRLRQAGRWISDPSLSKRRAQP